MWPSLMVLLVSIAFVQILDPVSVWQAENLFDSSGCGTGRAARDRALLDLIEHGLAALAVRPLSEVGA
jgi:hypothetical protein